MRILKWAGVGAGALLVLLLIAGAVLYLVGSSRLAAVYQVQTANLALPADSASLAHGKHLSYIHGCRDCHTQDLSGQVFIDEPPFRVVASNLTPGAGGVGSQYSAVDFDRAIRHGLRPDGSPLFIMPSAAYHRLSDTDAAALIAYLKTLPPVDNELPSTEVRAPGRLMAAVLLDPAFEVRTTPARAGAPPPAGPTPDYGAYLASITCAYCHGDDLRGSQPPMPGSPPAPDLVAAGQWTLAQFKEALRTGERPGGVALNAEFMPLSFTKTMEDYELEALHAYLGTIEARATL